MAAKYRLEQSIAGGADKFGGGAGEVGGGAGAGGCIGKRDAGVSVAVGYLRRGSGSLLGGDHAIFQEILSGFWGGDASLKVGLFFGESM
jgi:hypothetical protein